MRLTRTTLAASYLILTSLTCAALADPGHAPRAARSVHLAYRSGEADAFYNEVMVERATPGSYFMVCGWGHGYFGMQELAGGKKVVLFSVWDPTRGDDAKKVPLEQRVEVPFQAEDVRIKRFGGEGTGGQCFFDFDWKVGQTYRFLVQAAVEGEKTAYAGYVYLPEQKAWKHLVTFRTRTGGDRLRGLYSFVEDFRRDGKSATEMRRATFGNGWVLETKGGAWRPVVKARFTASDSKTEAKDTIDAGATDGRFYLQTGGETQSSRAVGAPVELPEAKNAPEPKDLPTESLLPPPAGEKRE